MGTEKHPKDVETALQAMMLFQEGAKKINAKRRHKKELEESLDDKL